MFSQHRGLRPVDITQDSADRPKKSDRRRKFGPRTFSSNPYSYHESFRRVAFHAAVIYRTPHAVYKYIYAPADRKEELFEVLSDPKENHNLILTADAGLIANMRSKMAQHGVVPVPR